MKTVHLFFMQQVIQIPIPWKPLRIGTHIQMTFVTGNDVRNKLRI